MAILPAFDLLLDSYPNLPLAKVKTMIGARVDADYVTNACTLRISRALNYSGVKVPFIKDAKGKQQTLKGSDALWYIFRVSVLEKYLNDTYGRADISVKGKPDEGVSRDPFLNAKGIIGMRVKIWTDATGHFTLWDGRKFVDDHDAYLSVASEVWLWKVP